MPAKVIGVAGRKGGVGKTTLSHAIALGAKHWGIDLSMYCLTDDRYELPTDARPYIIEDCRQEGSLEQVVKKFRYLDKARPDLNALLVIDGGGNRSDLDRYIAQIADLIVLPFFADGESYRTVKDDLKRITRAVALPNRWSQNVFERKVDDEYSSALEKNFPGRVLMPVPKTASIRDLLLTSFDARKLSTPARRTCRAVAGQIIHHIRGQTDAAEAAAADAVGEEEVTEAASAE